MLLSIVCDNDSTATNSPTVPGAVNAATRSCSNSIWSSSPDILFPIQGDSTTSSCRYSAARSLRGLRTLRTAHKSVLELLAQPVRSAAGKNRGVRCARARGRGGWGPGLGRWVEILRGLAWQLNDFLRSAQFYASVGLAQISAN